MDRWLIYHRWIIETQLGHQNFVTSASPAKKFDEVYFATLQELQVGLPLEQKNLTKRNEAGHSTQGSHGKGPGHCNQNLGSS